MVKKFLTGLAAIVLFVFMYLLWGTDALEKAQVVTRTAEILKRPELCLEISNGIDFFDATLSRENCQGKARPTRETETGIYEEFLKGYGLSTRFAHFRQLPEVLERKVDFETPPAPDPSVVPSPSPMITPSGLPKADPGARVAQVAAACAAGERCGTVRPPAQSCAPVNGIMPGGCVGDGPLYLPTAPAPPPAVPAVNLPAYDDWVRKEYLQCELESGSLATHLKKHFDLVMSAYFGKPSIRSCSIGAFIGLPPAETPMVSRRYEEGGSMPFTPAAAIHARKGPLVFYPRADFALDCGALLFGFRKDHCHLRAATLRRGTYSERKAHCLAIGDRDIRSFCQNLAAEAGDQPHPNF